MSAPNARKRTRPAESESKAPADPKRVKGSEKAASTSAAVAAAPPKVKAGGVVAVSAIEAIGRIDTGVREAREKPIESAAPPPAEIEVNMRELFRKTARQIQDLGATALTGSVKREWETKRTVELGGKAPKNIKTPINILRGMRAKAKEREAQRVERERAQGLDPRPKASPSQARKEAPRRDLPVPSTVGRFSKGILTLSRHDVARIQSTDRRPPSLAKAFKRR